MPGIFNDERRQNGAFSRGPFRVGLKWPLAASTMLESGQHLEQFHFTLNRRKIRNRVRAKREAAISDPRKSGFALAALVSCPEAIFAPTQRYALNVHRP